MHFYEIFTNLAQENVFIFFFYFFITNMESTKCKNNTIEDNKQVLNLIIKEFRELIGLSQFKTDKKKCKNVKKTN